MRDKQVPLLVEIPVTDGQTHRTPVVGHVRLMADVSEGAVTLVAVESVVRDVVRHIEINSAVPRQICPGSHQASPLRIDDARLLRYLRERPVPVVAVEGTVRFGRVDGRLTQGKWSRDVDDEKVGPAVVVVIQPRGPRPHILRKLRSASAREVLKVNANLIGHLPEGDVGKLGRRRALQLGGEPFNGLARRVDRRFGGPQPNCEASHQEKARKDRDPQNAPAASGQGRKHATEPYW